MSIRRQPRRRCMTPLVHLHVPATCSQYDTGCCHRIDTMRHRWGSPFDRCPAGGSGCGAGRGEPGALRGRPTTRLPGAVAAPGPAGGDLATPRGRGAGGRGELRSAGRGRGRPPPRRAVVRAAARDSAHPADPRSPLRGRSACSVCLIDSWRRQVLCQGLAGRAPGEKSQRRPSGPARRRVTLSPT